MRISPVWLAALFASAILLNAPGVFASDHTNTDDHFPVTVEDAYPVEYGAIELQLGTSYEDRDRGPDTLVIRPEITWGAFRNTHLWIEGQILTNRNGRDNTAGFGVLHNFNAETLSTPAFALSLHVKTAFNGSTDSTVRGILTKSCGRNRFNLNLDYTDVGDADPGERSGRYLVGLGWDRSCGIGTLLLADVVTQSSAAKGEDNETLLEFGVRYQVDPDVVLACGVGVGLTGDSDSRNLTAMVGVQMSL